MRKSIFESSLLLGYQEQEQSIYVRSVAAISADARLTDYFLCTDTSAHFLVAQMKGYPPDKSNEDENTLQYIGVRFLNSLLSSVRLMLNGYYQGSLAQMRDLAEIGLLLEYFSVSPEHITKWWNSDDKARMKHYKPARLRKELNKHEGQESTWRDRIYNILCAYGTHVNRNGFSIITNELDEITPGPFYDLTKLRACVEQLIWCVPYPVQSFTACLVRAYPDDLAARLDPIFEEFKESLKNVGYSG